MPDLAGTPKDKKVQFIVLNLQSSGVMSNTPLNL